MPRDTPENRATQRVLLATAAEVCWFRNNQGVADFNPVCPHCGTRRDPRRGESKVVYGVGGKGGADYLGIVRKTGRFIAAELKSADGRATPEQLAFLDMCRRAGALAVLARVPEDVLEVIR